MRFFFLCEFRFRIVRTGGKYLNGRPLISGSRRGHCKVCCDVVDKALFTSLKYKVALRTSTAAHIKSRVQAMMTASASKDSSQDTTSRVRCFLFSTLIGAKLTLQPMFSVPGQV